MLIIVTMKLILPRMLLIPATCREKIIRSTLNLLDPNRLDKGGYMVQPAPTPFWMFNDMIKNHRDTGNSQKDNAFNRGKTKSGVFRRIGSIQFPKKSNKGWYNEEKDY